MKITIQTVSIESQDLKIKYILDQETDAQELRGHSLFQSTKIIKWIMKKFYSNDLNLTGAS